MVDKRLLGGMLVAAGAVELAVTLFVIGPRLSEHRRRILTNALGAGALVLLGLGLALLAGVL